MGVLHNNRLNEAVLFQKIWHGGDYNPEQWLDRPEVLEQDIQWMKEASINCVSLGIFSWAEYEPREGEFHFEWLDQIINRLYENGIYTILATPTGALPIWMQHQYEEVRQVRSNRIRNLPGNRHNFCYSSPIMREKMQIINGKLAKRYGNHPAVIAWHISNEYGNNGTDSSCHCPYCQEEFRNWLQDRYQTLENLNKAWWTKFWSHTYQEWNMIESPAPHGETMLHGLKLDWKRFVSDRIQNFCEAEIQVIRQYSDRPITTNYMEFFGNVDYFKLGKQLDFISLDSYPDWHEQENEMEVAAMTAAGHALMRSIKKQPFFMMENTPSITNWKSYNIAKRPGMHRLSAMQAIADGANSIQYFQWRQSRGAFEKFHGAVIGHKNGHKSKVFQEVAELGDEIRKLSEFVTPTQHKSKIAIIFDWENWWALEECQALWEEKQYVKTIVEHFRIFWKQGISVDFVDMECTYFNDYEVVIAPLNYMYREHYVEKIKDYVENGGIYVTTYWSGVVNESDLCFVEKHPLQEVLGIENEMITLTRKDEEVKISMDGSSYPIKHLYEEVQKKGAREIAVYDNGIYKGLSAITQNDYGQGKAYYLAVEPDYKLLEAFYKRVLDNCSVKSPWKGGLPEEVVVTVRQLQEKFYFVQNFSEKNVTISCVEGYEDCIKAKRYENEIKLLPYECKILKRY